jgi:uncharacterized membrane protein YkoI
MTGEITLRFLPLLIISCLLAVTPAAAQDAHGERRIQTAQNDGMSLSDAVEQVRRQTDGRIISAETRVSNGREVHHIKVLTKDGKVKTHKIQGRKRGNG